MFTWVQQRFVEAELLKGNTIAIDATTLEANAAMRSIVRRDTGESYQAFLTRLAKASGIETPTREDLARLDRKRKKKTSNKDWTHPHGSRREGHQDERRPHALGPQSRARGDLDTGAIVAVTLQGADQGDTTTILETATAAAEQIEDGADRRAGSAGTRRGHRRQGLPQQSVDGGPGRRGYPLVHRGAGSRPPRLVRRRRRRRRRSIGNRRRIRGRRGHRLMRRRGERIERSFAHLYDTGGMRRTHLRGHRNILKRLLVHAGGFNLGLLMRT